jgi:iron-sulfur cluster insertion protein
MALGTITVTPAAQARFKQLIGENQTALGVRVEILAGGCAGFKYKFGYLTEITDNDLVAEYDDLKVAIDNTSCTLMEGTEIDYVEEDFGARFVFNNPNTTAKCGCGKSFNV